jgi:hypothetical protein
MYEEYVKKITSTSAWLAAAAKSLDRIAKWPDMDPSKKPAIEEFTNGLEKVGVRLVELAEEVKKINA